MFFFYKPSLTRAALFPFCIFALNAVCFQRCPGHRPFNTSTHMRASRHRKSDGDFSSLFFAPFFPLTLIYFPKNEKAPECGQRRKRRRRREAGGERHSWKKATLIMMMMRERERHRAVRSTYSFKDNGAQAGWDRQRGRGEGVGGEGVEEGARVRAPSRSDAIVVPQHFLSAAAVFVCPVSTATADT